MGTKHKTETAMGTKHKTIEAKTAQKAWAKLEDEVDDVKDWRRVGSTRHDYSDPESLFDYYFSKSV